VSFTDALDQNPAPLRLGDVRLRYEPGRLMGESLPPSLWERQLPGICLSLAALCALGALGGVLLESQPLPVISLLLAVGAVALVGLALRLEGRLGRRRFVLHFATETLRLDQLRWAPGSSRTELVHFDAVRAVEVVERASRRYALVVAWSEGKPADKPQEEEPQDDAFQEEAPPNDEPLRRAVLVEGVGPKEQEALLRVWRLLHNAFGLRGAGLAGG
jgi:hypothetical protein